MKDSTKKAVDKAIDNYRDDMTDAATAVAIEAHISGDIAAHAAMGIPIGKMEVQKEALLFGRKYKKLLKETGGTIIQGKRIDWLASHTEDTRKAVYETIRAGLIEGKPVADIGGKLSVPGTVAHDLEKLVIRDAKYKYVRIARTETAAIQNQGTLNRFKKNKITHVEVIDGTDFDEACAEANGQIWTVEYASTHELEHPNCTRSFSPVIPDDWVAPEEVEKKPKVTKKPAVRVPTKPAKPKVVMEPDESDLWGLPPEDFKIDLSPVVERNIEPDLGVAFKKIDKIKADSEISAHTTELMKKNPKAWSETLFEISDYVEEGYVDINKALRSDFAGLSKGDKLLMNARIQKIDDFLKNAPKVKGKVYRGASFDNKKDFDDFIKAFDNSDSTLMESFTSTSADLDVASAFAEGEGGYSVIFNMDVNNGVFVNGFSMLEEAEVLIKHHTRFSVQSIERKAERYYIINLREMA